MGEQVLVDQRRVHDALIVLRHYKDNRDKSPYNDWICGMHAGFKIAMQMLGLIDLEKELAPQAAIREANEQNSLQTNYRAELGGKSRCQ